MIAPSSNLCTGTLLGVVALVTALLAPALAGEAPLLARVDGTLCAPALTGYPLGAALTCPGGGLIDWKAERRSGGRLILLDVPVPFGPEATDLNVALLPPGSPHWLGTDALGRDLLSRVIHGFPVALLVGGLAAILSLGLGLCVGSAAGMGGRWLDLGLSRVMDLMACFPTLILALALAAGAKRPGLGSLIIAIGVTRWTAIARFLRGELLRQRGLPYCDSALAAGSGRLRLVLRHLLPNALSPILVTAAFSVSHAMLLEAGMSFLGLGLPPGTASWGGILSEAQRQVVPAWWLVLFPSLALFLTVLSCNLLAEGVRESNDPRLPRPV